MSLVCSWSHHPPVSQAACPPVAPLLLLLLLLLRHGSVHGVTDGSACLSLRYPAPSFALCAEPHRSCATRDCRVRVCARARAWEAEEEEEEDSSTRALHYATFASPRGNTFIRDPVFPLSDRM
ncbi:hypothetical protein EYF80_029001 [Liparis tanakae]|uniref:Secreted protein n=1 Tax=Liparis tanakae TaxID=230148 RepID=A0A4Z2H4G6_9TELE|nr:hypothetical protein EYF80_029001 [Liparis tanakae]